MLLLMLELNASGGAFDDAPPRLPRPTAAVHLLPCDVAHFLLRRPFACSSSVAASVHPNSQASNMMPVPRGGFFMQDTLRCMAAQDFLPPNPRPQVDCTRTGKKPEQFDEHRCGPSETGDKSKKLFGEAQKQPAEDEDRFSEFYRTLGVLDPSGVFRPAVLMDPRPEERPRC